MGSGFFSALFLYTAQHTSAHPLLAWAWLLTQCKHQIISCAKLCETKVIPWSLLLVFLFVFYICIISLAGFHCWFGVLFQKTKGRSKFHTEKHEYFSWWWSNARKSDSTSIEGRQVGKWNLFGVSLAVVDHIEEKLFYLGKARLESKPTAPQLRRLNVQVCWHPPYTWLLMEYGSIASPFPNSSMSEGCYKKHNLSLCPQHWKFSSPIYLLWLFWRRKLHVIFHYRCIYNIYIKCICVCT